MSAILSECGTYRYRLERDVGMAGPVYAYFGVNCSTADHTANDNTVARWIGFTKLFGGSRFIVGNPFAFRSPEVKDLASAVDPVGPENEAHIARIIADADILVPCWGLRRRSPGSCAIGLRRLRKRCVPAASPSRCLACQSPAIHSTHLGFPTQLISLTGSVADLR